MENIKEMANIPHIHQRFRLHYGVLIPDNMGNYRIHAIRGARAYCISLRTGKEQIFNILPSGLLTKFRLTPHEFYRTWNAVFIPTDKSDPKAFKITGTFPNFYLPDGRQVWMTSKWFALQPFDYIDAMMLKTESQMTKYDTQKRWPDLTGVLEPLVTGQIQWSVFIDGVLHNRGVASDNRSAEYVARRSLGARSNNALRLRFV